MVLARNYSRFFVTLKQERPDYCLDFRPVMGRCIIEIRNGKGKMMAYVQGLKPQVLYKLYLVACTDMTSDGVAVGSVQVDSSGKGELKCEFDPDNVNDTGYSIEKFNAVTLMVPKNGEIVAPLVGYFENPVMWKNNFTFFKHKDNDSIAESKEEVSDSKEEKNKDDLYSDDKLNKESDEKSVADINEQDIENDKPENEHKEENESVEQNNDNSESEILENNESVVSESSDSQDEQNDNHLNVKEEGDTTESVEISQDESKTTDDDNSDIGLFQKKVLNESVDSAKNNNEQNNNINSELSERFEHQDQFKDIVGRFKKELEELKYYTKMQEKYNEQKPESFFDTGDNNIDYMFSHNAQMQPFRHPDNDTEWIRVSPHELSAFPGDFYKYINNPFVCSANKKYKHLIMGRKKKDGKWCYILGIPEKYVPSYKLDASFQKFNRFRCCDDNKPAKGSYGYWLSD